MTRPGPERALLPSLLCLSLLLPAPDVAGAAPEPLASVPLEFSNRVATVTVGINGEGPFSFLLDTSVPQTAIRERLASRLGLTGLGPGNVGGIHEGERVRLDSVTLGDLELRDVEVVSVDFSKITGDEDGPDGLMGFSFFADYLWTLDYAERRLVLERGSLPASGAGILELTLEEGTGPTISIQIAGREMRSRLNPGSFGGVALPHALMEDVPLASEPGKIGRTGSPEGVFDLYGARLDGAVRLGDQSLERPRVLFSEAYRTANLGPSALEEFAVTFDAANGRVRFQRKESLHLRELHANAARVKTIDGRRELRTTFNEETGKVRMLLILSPT